MLFLNKKTKGFSLVEVSVTFAIAALISAAVVVVLQGSASPGADTSAKTALLETAQSQSSFYSKYGSIASLADMNTSNTSLTYTDSESTGPLVVSLGSASSSFYAAVSASEGSCWLLQLNYNPTEGQDPQVWAVSDNVECSHASASLLSPSGTDVGTSPSKPQQLVTASLL